MIARRAGARRCGAHGLRRRHARPRVRAGAAGAARVADRGLARAPDRLRRGRRRLDGADPRHARRRHGPRRHALVPHAARGPVRADGAHFGTIDYFDPIFFASFYPANSEVVHAVPLLAFDRDILSPLLNLGWLALGAARPPTAIGRPYGRRAAGLIGGAIALGAQNLVEFQAGEALNDIVGVALLLARRRAARQRLRGRASASRGRRGVARSPLGAARRSAGPRGRAGGGDEALVPGARGRAVRRADRDRAAAARACATGALVRAPGARSPAATGTSRNLIAVGNPIPYTPFGPLGLPAPERAFELRPGFSVFHYGTDFDVWSDWFFPGLDDSFGFLWPLVLAAFVGAGVYALWRGREPLLRVLGAVVLFTAVAYVFTPLTAAGEEGRPIAFVWNVRYLAPAAAVGLAILPCLPIAAAHRRAPRGDHARRPLRCCSRRRSTRWSSGSRATSRARSRPGVAVLAGVRGAPWLRSRGRSARRARRSPGSPGSPRWSRSGRSAPAGGSSATTSSAATRTSSPQLKLADAVRWARDLRDATVAVAGIRGVFNQYPFYGTDLSNQVQWLGRRRAGRRLRADPDLRRVAPGARRRRLHPRRHHLRPVQPRHAHRHQGGAVDARGPGAEADPPRRAGERVRAHRAARSRRLRRPARPEPGRARRRLRQRRPDREPALSGSADARDLRLRAR